MLIVNWHNLGGSLEYAHNGNKKVSRCFWRWIGTNLTCSRRKIYQTYILLLFILNFGHLWTNIKCVEHLIKKGAFYEPNTLFCHLTCADLLFLHCFLA